MERLLNEVIAGFDVHLLYLERINKSSKDAGSGWLPDRCTDDYFCAARTSLRGSTRVGAGY